jgi:hypothetical protein
LLIEEKQTQIGLSTELWDFLQFQKERVEKREITWPGVKMNSPNLKYEFPIKHGAI